MYEPVSSEETTLVPLVDVVNLFTNVDSVSPEILNEPLTCVSELTVTKLPSSLMFVSPISVAEVNLTNAFIVPETDTEVPDEPEVPLVPDEPSEPLVPDVPLDPLVPDVPAVPELPEEPDVPLVPLEPSEPLEPEVPLVPDEPSLPELPEVPAVPEEPELPDVPLEPDVPAVPLEPEEPLVPEVPAVPDEPLEPEVPLVPEVAAVYHVPLMYKSPELIYKEPVTFVSATIETTLPSSEIFESPIWSSPTATMILPGVICASSPNEPEFLGPEIKIAVIPASGPTSGC